MESPHRKPTRWPGFDYHLPGPYHVVICTEGRANRLATIERDSCVLHPAGEMVSTLWQDGPDRFPELGLDAFVVMPNHMHLVFWFEPVPDRPCPTVGDVMKWLKSESTVLYGRGVRTSGWPAFAGRLWQRNYYDRVIRTDRELDAVRQYIDRNPMVWREDSLYRA